MKNTLRDFTRLVKFEHTLFTLPFAFIGFFLAVRQESGVLTFVLLLKVIVCMVFARNAAIGFNRYLDRSFSATNRRPTMREIPAEAVFPKKARIFIIANSLLFVVMSWSINNLCFYLSPVVLFVILGYSYTKRITPLCHFVLSAGLALTPIGAYLAVTGQFATPPLLFSILVFFWVSGFDIIYASQDIEFDRANNLNSIPAMLGIKKAFQLSIFLHFITVVTIIIAGIVLESDWLYWIGALIFITLLAYQHLIIKPDNLNRLNLVFGTTNAIASIIFASYVIASFYQN